MILFSRVGIVGEILTDQGACFMSRVIKDLLSMLQVRHLRTSVYHPQTDGLVERFKSFHQWMEKTGTSYFHTYYSLSGKYPMLPLASLTSSYSMADDRECYSTSPGTPGRINPPHTALSSNTWSRCEAGWHRSSPWSGNTSDEPNKHRPGCTIWEPKCAPSTGQPGPRPDL